jgi:hypothetical protein
VYLLSEALIHQRLEPLTFFAIELEVVYKP